MLDTLPQGFATATLPSLPASVLSGWSHRASHALNHTILPDGCQDLILIQTAAGPPRWHFAALASHAETIQIAPGDCFIGFRLHPACLIEAGALSSLLAHQPCPASALQLLGSASRIHPQLAEALQGLAESARITKACAQLGVSERSLQRLVQRHTGRTPAFWLQLARARRSARRLCANPLPLCDLAADEGYADQAHLSREFRRWFGISPGHLRSQTPLQAQLLAPAYGAMGEHSSIR